MAKQSLIKGTIILTIAAFITRLLGFTNGIVMANIIGPEGAGLITMAIPVSGFLITLTTLGLPVAISKLVAEVEAKRDHLRVKKILIVSLAMTSILGFVLMIGTFMSAKLLSSVFLTDQRAYYSLIPVIPIAPIIAVSSVIKGYFLGKQNMTPTAFSQVIEQFVRIGFIFIFVQWLLPYGKFGLGWSWTALATKQYGIIMGYVLPLLILPGFITNSMSIPLIPAISEANEKNELSLIHNRTQQAVRIALIVGVPCTIILYLFAEVLTPFIYRSPEAAILPYKRTPSYRIVPFNEITLPHPLLGYLCYNSILQVPP